MKTSTKNASNKVTREEVLNTVKPKLVNANSETYEAVTKQLLDLKIIYTVETTKSVFIVTEKSLESLNITPDQLYVAAIENIASTAIIEPITTVLGRLKGEEVMSDEPASLFVVTTASMNFGAAAILTDCVKDRLHDLLGDTFFILPSSVHEVLALSDNGLYQTNDLFNMVTNINATELKQEDRLSDNVYICHGHQIKAYK